MRSSKVETLENSADIADMKPQTSEAGTPIKRSSLERPGAPPTRAASARQTVLSTPFLLYGIYLFCIGIVMYLIGISAVVPRYLLGLYDIVTPISKWLVWYSGLPMTFGFAFALFDILVTGAKPRAVIGRCAGGRGRVGEG
jgi:hypothetical protein